MKVRLYGFSLAAGHTKTSLVDLYDHLAMHSGQPDTTKSLERRIYFDKNDGSNYAHGLVVTVRDQKAFCKLIEDNGNWVINVESLQGDDKLMEFNFFIINKSNGLGLYQHYFHSCSMGVFGGYLRTDYREISDQRCQDAIHASEQTGRHTNAKEAAIKRDHRGQLEVATLVHSGSLSSVLQDFDRINSFEYEFAELEAIRDVAEPLSPYVRRRKEVVTFEREQNVRTLANAVQRAVNLIQPRAGRVHVETEDGDALSLQLENIPEHFGEYDYDDVARQLNNLNVLEFSRHNTFTQLNDVCNSDAYRHIFNARIR